jgi:hypothetical protein
MAVVIYCGLIMASTLAPISANPSQGSQTSPSSLAGTSSSTADSGQSLPYPKIPLRPKRSIQFPQKNAFGALSILPAADYNTPRAKQPLFKQARGTIEVAPGQMVILKAGHELLEHPEALDNLPPDAIDVLRVEATSLADNEDGMADGVLQHARHLKGLIELNLDRSDVSDAGLAYAAELPNLQRVGAYSTRITGSCFKQLSNHKKLMSLGFAEDTIKEENLHYLSTLPDLRCISLRRTGLSVAGMREVAKCTNLRSLDIARNPKIDDRCIQYIRPLKKLGWLWLNETKISVKGLLQLKGLPLHGIVLPAAHYSQSELTAIAKVLPGATLSKGVGAPIDEDAQTLFAPMH